MNILVCDDHPIVAAALSSSLESLFEARVHLAESFHKALLLAAEKAPFDLCVLDLHLPREDSRSGLLAIRELLPDTPILVFSGSEDDADLRMVLELDLHGFLHKSSSPEVVEAAVRLVLAGGRYLPERAAELLLNRSEQVSVDAGRSRGPHSGVQLTPRQKIVLDLLAQGRSNKAIARELGISPATVKAHVAQVIGALGARNRTEAASRARDMNLL